MNTSNWEIQNGRLTKVFKFKNFIHAFGFMGQVALVAEKMNHHPNWSNVYNTVTIELFTHSKSEITEKDHTLANSIDKIFDEKNA